MMDLKGKKILVTGGSRGIGAGVVQRLSELGATVAFTYASRSDAAESVLRTLKGSGHFHLKMDVKDSSSIQAGISQVLETFGELHGLVNNAGITKDQLLLRMKDEDLDEVLTTNLRGSILCAKAVLKPMIKQRNGSIVNISSVVGAMGNPGQSNYVASKAGIEGFSRALALEVASRNVRVNAVAPGFIATDMTENMTEDQKKAISERIPMGKMGSSDDIANSVAFLLSDMSQYITGQVLHVNGGLYL